MTQTKTLLFLAAAAVGLTLAGAGVAQIVQQRIEIHRPAFADIDANHDGSISQAEFDAFKPAPPPGAPDMPPPPGHPGDHTMIFMDHKAMDANGDGRISQDEFLAPAKDHFARLDANHDGVLDGGEMPPMPPMGEAPAPAQ